MALYLLMQIGLYNNEQTMTKELEELQKKVIRHDYEFEALTKGQLRIAEEIHTLALSLKEVFNDKFETMDKQLHESFLRVHKRQDEIEAEIDKIIESQNTTGGPALKLTNKSIEVLNIAVFGKEGRGGAIFDIADLKKFMYKISAGFTVVNLTIGVIVALYTKG